MVKTFLGPIISFFLCSPSFAEDPSPFSDVEAAFDKVEKQTNESYTQHELQAEQAFKDLEERVKRTWSDGAIPEVKINVIYGESDLARTKIDYENGKITVEALKNPGESDEVVKKRATKILESIISTNTDDPKAIITTDEITSDKTSPSTLAENFSAKLTPANQEAGTDHISRPSFKFTLSLVPEYIKKRAARYKPIVELWAKKYKIDPAFVLAIIRQESSFNPHARSWVPAYGLMQIVPKYAGQEVLKAVTGKNTLPDSDFLFTPEKNIMMGATYLQILRDQYFSDIKDEQKRQYLITAAYNWGPHRIRNAFKKGRLNSRAPASEIFDKLQQIAPAETQIYLRKVTQYANEFRGT